MLRKVLSMLLAITAVLAAAGYVSAEEYSYTYSDYLYQPAPVVPAFALPGESFELYVKEESQ